MRSGDERHRAGRDFDESAFGSGTICAAGTSLETRVFLRTGAGAGMLGGIVLLAGGVAGLFVNQNGSVPLSKTVTESIFLLHIRLNLLGFLLILIAFPAIQFAQLRRAPRIGVAVFVLAFIGLAFMLAHTTIMGFVAPRVAEVGPSALDGEWKGSMALLGFGFPIFALGMLAFAGYCLFERVYPWMAPALLLVGAAVDILGAFLPFRVPDTIFFGGATFLWLGIALWRSVEDRATSSNAVGSQVDGAPAHR